MTDIDLTTGLPVLPEGQRWVVREDLLPGALIGTGIEVAIVEDRKTWRGGSRERTVDRAFIESPDLTSRYASPAEFYALTEKAAKSYIRVTAEQIIKGQELEAHRAKVKNDVLGSYPPKSVKD